jgi:hypothetical protein
MAARKHEWTPPIKRGGETTCGRFVAPKQPPAGYTGLIGIGDLYLEEDVAAAGIRNPREVLSRSNLPQVIQD